MENDVLKIANRFSVICTERKKLIKAQINGGEVNCVTSTEAGENNDVTFRDFQTKKKNRG